MSKIPFVSKEKVQEIASKYPTPFHLYDEKGLRENTKDLYKLCNQKNLELIKYINSTNSTNENEPFISLISVIIPIFLFLTTSNIEIKKI